MRKLRQAAHRPLHQPGDFRVGGGDVEAFVFGGAADEDLAVVLLRHVAVAGGQAAVEDFRHALGQQNLPFHRFHRNADAGRPFAQVRRPGTAGIDQRLAVEHALLGRLYAGDPRAVVQHAGDVGVDEDIDTILPRAFHVGVGEAERADLMVAEKLQRPACFMTDAGLGFAQCGLIEPAHLIGQMRNAADDMFGVEAVFIVINHEFEPGLFELEIHAVIVFQFTVQRRVQRVGLQGKIKERLWQDMRRAGVHCHRRALGFALAVGRHHAEENHPAPQAHRLADRPQTTG